MERRRRREGGGGVLSRLIIHFRQLTTNYLPFSSICPSHDRKANVWQAHLWVGNSSLMYVKKVDQPPHTPQSGLGVRPTLIGAVFSSAQTLTAVAFVIQTASGALPLSERLVSRSQFELIFFRKHQTHRGRVCLPRGQQSAAAVHRYWFTC